MTVCRLESCVNSTCALDCLTSLFWHILTLFWHVKGVVLLLNACRLKLVFDGIFISHDGIYVVITFVYKACRCRYSINQYHKSPGFEKDLVPDYINLFQLTPWRFFVPITDHLQLLNKKCYFELICMLLYLQCMHPYNTCIGKGIKKS